PASRTATSYPRCAPRRAVSSPIGPARTMTSRMPRGMRGSLAQDRSPPREAAPGFRREIGAPIYLACGAGCYTALLVVELPGRPHGRHGRARREALTAGHDRPRRLAPGTGARGDSMPKSMFVNVTAEEENRVAIVENGVLDVFEI